MKSVVRIAGHGKGGRNEADAAVASRVLALDSRVAMIQALIPVALDRVQELPHEEAAMTRLYKELAQLNLSAARSLAEGLEDALTRHRLGLFGLLGRLFKTTNCIENMNSMVGQRTDKVDR